jgi:hypothetical protein
MIVPDLDQTLALLKGVVGDEPELVLDVGGGVGIALLGGFLVIAGPEEIVSGFRGAAGSVVVGDLGQVEKELRQAGAEITKPPSPTPLGEFLWARHPDGTVLEYMTLDQAKLAAARSATR